MLLAIPKPHSSAGSTLPLSTAFRVSTGASGFVAHHCCASRMLGFFQTESKALHLQNGCDLLS